MQTALITGTSSGIGLHLAMQLCQEGWDVYGIFRNPSRFASALRKEGLEESERFHPIVVDIDDPAAVALALASIPAPDVLVNNAGYGLYGVFEELEETQLREQFETNFFSALRLIRHYLPEMRRRGSGRIINVTSILGTMVLPTGFAYCSSKWALEAATEALRYEVAPFGIEVCAVEPGLVSTGFKSSIRVAEGSADSSSPYHFLNRLVNNNRSGYDRFSTTPRAAARSILRLLRRRRLPGRFRVGLDAEFYHILRSLLPASLLDALLRIYVEQLHRQR